MMPDDQDNIRVSKGKSNVVDQLELPSRVAVVLEMRQFVRRGSKETNQPSAPRYVEYSIYIRFADSPVECWPLTAFASELTIKMAAELINLQAILTL